MSGLLTEKGMLKLTQANDDVAEVLKKHFPTAFNDWDAARGVRTVISSLILYTMDAQE